MHQASATVWNQIAETQTLETISLGSSSKLTAECDFLVMLRDEGRRRAKEFLAHHSADLGRRSSLDLDQLLEGV